MSTLVSASESQRVEHHLDLVDHALTTLSRRLPDHVSRDDLASVGKLALIAALPRAAQLADDVRAYCFVRVRGAMLDELRRLDPLSRQERDALTRVVRAQTELGTKLGRAASRVELAASTGLTLQAVTQVLARMARESSPGETELEALPDTEAPSPAQHVELDDLRLNLRGALERLSTVQAAVLYRYYFEDATLENISTELGVSKERVRQIREAAEKKLRSDFVVLALWQSLIGSPERKPALS